MCVCVHVLVGVHVSVLVWELWWELCECVEWVEGEVMDWRK